MKISLEGLDTRAVLIDLPGPSGEGNPRVAVRSAAGLRGVIEQDSDRLRVSGAAAETLALEALRVLLGRVLLSSNTGVSFEGLAVALDRTTRGLALDVGCKTLHALDLRVAVDDVLVAGRFTLVGARLSVQDDEGSLLAERIALESLTVRVGDVELTAETLAGRSVALRWGAAGFALAAAALESPALRVTTPEIGLAMTGADLGALTLDSARIAIDHLALQGAELAMTLDSAKATAGPETAAAPPAAGAGESAPGGGSGEPWLDLGVLDGLSGEMNIDVEVDLTVPILGTRRATHRLRIDVADGALDYRALEGDLSALENALLDFAVREGALALERINPLFPARGHGKPVILWDLEPPDLELAERNRVRLAVLPRARLAAAGADAERADTDPGPKSFALRELGLRSIDVRLALAPGARPQLGHLRPHRIDAVVLQGSVFHRATESPSGSAAGSLLGELSGLAGSIAGLRLGKSHLDIANVMLASASPIEVTFEDIRPTALQIGMSGVALQNVVYRLAPAEE